MKTSLSALKTLGDWLKGSDWVQALVQAEIATAGTADSFLHAAHVTHTRRVHQVTVAVLNILKHRAYAISHVHGMDRMCLGSSNGVIRENKPAHIFSIGRL